MEVTYKPTFVRMYKRLDPALQEEVKEKIALFRDEGNHTLLKVHKLKGRLKGKSSFSVNYNTRIVFRYEDTATAVLLSVGGHEVYKK